MIGEDHGRTSEASAAGTGQMLDAIARGVETKWARTLLRNIVMDQTAGIARKLGIPEGEILRWQSFRRLRLEFAADQGELASQPGARDNRAEGLSPETSPEA